MPAKTKRPKTTRPRRLTRSQAEMLWEQFGKKYLQTISMNNLKQFQRVYRWYTIGDAYATYYPKWEEAIRNFVPRESYESDEELIKHFKSYVGPVVMNFLRNFIRDKVRYHEKFPEYPLSELTPTELTGGDSDELSMEPDDVYSLLSTEDGSEQDRTIFMQLRDIKNLKLPPPYDEIVLYLAQNYERGEGGTVQQEIGLKKQPSVWDYIEKTWGIKELTLKRKLRNFLQLQHLRDRYVHS